MEAVSSTSSEGSESKPNVNQQQNALNLRVISQHGNETFFKLKRTTALGKLMSAYCERSGIDEKSVRFLYDGKRLLGTETPADLEMEDNDIVDVMLQQTGGA